MAYLATVAGVKFNGVAALHSQLIAEKVPKLEVDYLFDLPDDLLSEMLLTARPVAAAIQKVVPCARIGLMVVGVDVPHVHLHLMPINGGGEMDFKNARPADPAALRDLGARIRAAM